MNAEPGLSERELVNPDGRRRMARVAVDLLAGCAIVMIDAGSTAAYVCEALAAAVPRSGRMRLTAITNSLRNAALLGANPAIRVMLAPGDYDPRENAVFGRHTIDFLARFRVGRDGDELWRDRRRPCGRCELRSGRGEARDDGPGLGEPAPRRPRQVRGAAVRADRGARAGSRTW